MALIGMAIYSTKENNKDAYLAQTLKSLEATVDFYKHRLGLSINASTENTERILKYWANITTFVNRNDTNIGTAEAINKIWQHREPGENAIKMDDDITIHTPDWLYLMEESISRDPSIGQIGLKRRDCIETPWNPDPFYKSRLRMLPHIPGQKWITIEEVSHVMGSCVMHSSALLDKVGYLYQPGLYGFDDSLMSVRSKLAGFKNAFLTAVDIEHIDPGTTEYQPWKEKSANVDFPKYIQAVGDYTSGKKPLYYNPF